MRSHGWWYLLGGLVVFLGCQGLQGAEAQISFQTKKGWIAFTLEKEGAPVADALVQILDESGAVFAEGTTGAKGQGQFPLPTWEQIKVEVKIGERSADTVVLTRNGDKVFPDEVLLSYGSKPCCKIVFLGTGSEGEIDLLSRLEAMGIPIWLQLLAGASLIVGGTYWAYSLGRASNQGDQKFSGGPNHA